MFNAHTRVFNASSLPERTDGRTDRRRRVRKSHVLHACARGFNKFRTHLDLKKIKCTPINRPYTYIPTSHDWSKTAVFSHRPGPVRSSVRPFVRSLLFHSGGEARRRRGPSVGVAPKRAKRPMVRATKRKAAAPKATSRTAGT